MSKTMRSTCCKEQKDEAFTPYFPKRHFAHQVTGQPTLEEKKVLPNSLPNKFPKLPKIAGTFLRWSSGRDNTWKKKTAALNNLTATNKSLEEEVQRLKQIAADAISKAKQLEKSWFNADLKWSEKEEELRNLKLDFSRIATERDDLQNRAANWPRKKKIVYRKGVEDAFFKARRQMIRRFKARESNWRTPESSDYEEGGDDPSEISSEEDEAEDNAGDEQNENIDPKYLPPASEKSRSPTRDSFVEAMEAVRFERVGPGTNVEEATSAA
ncbi:hypothetical protein FNV43_RR07238 [Rhamnella rubrinervis]|uniref:Uncharacterized protein n=1 Tax=Rhamnella rubrinervis TaxID=2594499 RepID=A0A8K0MM65_9ROSA|nr:hypothetical protein FNV43_RR07238 [Rhamnella rubrinervis]